jgi:(p)ppGpp synthase/HD superfamily hydrolase
MMAELSHRGQYRESGEPYLDHPWAIVSEMLEFPELAEHAALINAMWVHDAPEDNDKLKQPRMDLKTGRKAKISYSLWEKGMEERLALVVGPQSAKYTMRLVRPQPDGWSLFSKKDANEEYYERLEEFPPVVIGKGFDRLHNGRTLWAMPEKNQIATIESTVRTYKPMLERVRGVYPRVVEYLITEIDKALAPIAEERGLDYDAIS